MRAKIAALACLLAGVAVAFAAPPTLTLPAEVAGEVAAFVTVKAAVTGDAKGVKYVPVDPGLSVFPSELLADKTVTVVVASKAGRYRVLAYSGNADGPSEPAMTTVVIGGAKPSDPPVVTPPPDKPTDPPADKPADVYYFAVVRSDQATKEIADAMRLPAWDELRAKGHVVKDIPVSELPSGLSRPATLPAVIVLKQNADGKTWTDTKQNKPMPTTNDAVRSLIK